MSHLGTFRSQKCPNSCGLQALACLLSRTVRFLHPSRSVTGHEVFIKNSRHRVLRSRYADSLGEEPKSDMMQGGVKRSSTATHEFECKMLRHSRGGSALALSAAKAFFCCAVLFSFAFFGLFFLSCF